jgi:hypothetical protein
LKNNNKQQETKVRWNKRKPIVMLAVHDSQCEFLKMLVNCF